MLTWIDIIIVIVRVRAILRGVSRVIARNLTLLIIIVSVLAINLLNLVC